MASETLSLFPSPVCSIPPKSCLRQAEDIHMRRNTPSPVLSSKPYPSGKLRGLALQFTPQVYKPSSVQSLESVATPSFSSPASSRSPEDTSMLSSSPPSEIAASTRRRPAVAIRKISIDTTSSDTRSDFSGPTLVRSNSCSSAQPRVVSPPIKSMFPEYDPSLPLSQQRYYPTENLPRPSLERSANYHHHTLADMPSPTSPTPAAGLSQLQALWNAASGQNGVFHSEKIKLTMHRDDIGVGLTATEVRLGSREGRTLYSVSPSDVSSELTVRRHHPARTGIVPVAQLDVAALQEHAKNETTIFPQQAAFNALEAIATTHRGNAIAQYDPRASSPQAAQLAFDAVAEAKAHESCQLVKISQGVSAYGIQEHSYELRHARAGTFAISIDGAFDFATRSNAKIYLHQPTSSEKPLAKPSKLVCLDLSTETLEVDVASFRRLQSKYMIDSTICAVLAVGFAESRLAETKAKAETFAAPPRNSKKINEAQKKVKNSRWRRSKKNGKKEVADEQEKLPSMTRGVLFLLGFSFEAIVWLLGLGVKVLSKVIVCASGTVSKK
ncbi:unnamed protein product [Aureobasidium uvarum]|uniref:Uncharacterized protein n=1 Tax=Aureobasidium uvarum TaxID=2773716 RepID=A0A9N8PXN8_9PEZI|nr:unnamed protein product [Aureobasidium uvarum]